MNGFNSLAAAVGAVEQGQHAVVKRLHPQADTVETQLTPHDCPLCTYIFRIGLQGDFCFRIHREQRTDFCQQQGQLLIGQQAGCAASQIDGGHRPLQVQLSQGQFAGQGLHQFRYTFQRSTEMKIAIMTGLPAIRYVQIYSPQNFTFGVNV